MCASLSTRRRYRSRLRLTFPGSAPEHSHLTHCHLDRRRHGPKAMKNGSYSATTVAGRAALPFVISTGAVTGLRPTQGDENGFCSATTLPGSAALPFVISTGARRSVVEICGFSGPFLGMFFDRAQRLERSAIVIPTTSSARETQITGRSGSTQR
jgi:hypothetical protein